MEQGPAKIQVTPKQDAAGTVAVGITSGPTAAKNEVVCNLGSKEELQIGTAAIRKTNTLWPE